MHVHGCFPYILVRPVGLFERTKEKVDKFVADFAANLNEFMNYNQPSETAKYDRLYKVSAVSAKLV